MAKEKTPKRWTSDYAEHVVDRADASGLSDTAFGKREGIDPQRISWWRKRLGRPRPPLARQTGFIEVRAAAATASSEVEIRLRNGRSVVVPCTIDPDRLSRLLDAVEQGSC